MKLKRILPLLAVSFMAVSCQKQTYAGTYGFSMGKEKGTHFGIYMILTDDEVKDSSEEVLGKKFTLKADFKMDGTAQKDDESLVMKMLSEIGEVPGYYEIGDKYDEDNLRLNIGVNIAELDFFKEIIGNIEEDFIIPNDFIEKVMFATINSTAVTLNLPVSISDFFFQVYWYGYEINFEQIEQLVADIIAEESAGTGPQESGDAENPTSGEDNPTGETEPTGENDPTEETNPTGEGEGTGSGSEETKEDEDLIVKVEEHPIGSHPTAEEIAKINEVYEAKHGIKYRDWHTLSLSLLKEHKK